VGKTETARTLAEFLFNDEKAMVRLDMSEYMESYSVSKIIGSPPGYVGFEEGGQITEKIRRRPYSVVLLDEIEKAHPDIFNVLLQIFEDGRLTDAKGRIVSFKNTILIMTSNIGSEYISQLKPIGFETKTEDLSQKGNLKNKIMDSLKEKFRPEFLNRIDEIIIFNYLGKKEIEEIVSLELDKVSQRLQKTKQIKIRFSEELKEALTKKGFDSDLGARPLKRVIQKLILDPLSLKIVSSETKEGDRVFVDFRKGEVIFQTPQLFGKSIGNREKVLTK
jgi:ATP-dependent Clp protease ATP-binding subunit ClpA